jgi:GMP synthase-like glutamine amidotransferase
MKNKKTKIAIIDNSINPEVYRPVVHWNQFLDFPSYAFTARNFEFPDFSSGYTHLIITGSEASILERDNWVYREIEVVREAVDSGLSILGSCYGHQLLALALFGPDRVSRCKKPELGWFSIPFDSNPLTGKAQVHDVFTSHFDEVVNLPSQCRIFAQTADCYVHAFQLENLPIWGIQPHPEISITEGQQFFKAVIAGGVTDPDLFQDALDTNPRDSGLIFTLIENFLVSEKSGG